MSSKHDFAITVLDVAIARGATQEPDGSVLGSSILATDVPLFGGCVQCEASITAYNAYPGVCGYWLCSDCISPETGFQTVEEFEKWAVEEFEKWANEN